MDTSVELLERRIARERIARKQAEQIIEEKSRELYLKGQELEHIAAAERQARAEAEVMLQAFEAFTSRLEHIQIVQRLEEFITRLIPHDHSALFFFDGENLRRQLLWANAEVEAAEHLGVKHVPEALLQAIKQTARPLLVSSDDLGVNATRWCMQHNTQTWMLVPIAAHGRNIGCLVLESQQTQAFNESALRIVQALANEFAIAFENARLFEEVKRLSTVDPLTSLFNRRHFNSAAQIELQRAERYHLSLTVILMDIDHFKKVNDVYGHAMGDRVLMEVAAVCLKGLRVMDLHARYGGEEFCFLLPETPLNGALQLAERIRASVAALQFDSEQGQLTVTASFGVTERIEPGDSLSHLQERADKALYAAKHGGRNQVLAWSDALACDESN